MDVMYNYSKAKIKSSLEIDKIMKKLENTYQDASLIKKALLGDASDKEQQVLEQRLSMHPELKAVYEKLQDSEELKDAFNKYKEYSSEKAYEHFLQQIQQKENSSGGKTVSYTHLFDNEVYIYLFRLQFLHQFAGCFHSSSRCQQVVV